MALDLPALRKDLHRHPELAFQEQRTNAILLDKLNEIKRCYAGSDGLDPAGFRIFELPSSTGLLVEYSYGQGSYRLFRADMDALPVSEATACGFASLNPGMMHACGHDIHMTVLIGLIEAVCLAKPARNLLFLFQPAEEGQGGAQSVLAEGILQTYQIDSAIALHVGSEMPVGTVASRPGIFFGIPQEFDVEFTGRAAHVAFPEKGVNAIAAAMDFLDRMRRDIATLSEGHRVIWHVGKISGGAIRNVIADRCLLEGTHRSLEKAARDAMNELIRKNAVAAAETISASARTELLCSYDPVVNNPALVEELSQTCASLGISYRTAPVVMTGEDFGFFTSLYPGLLFWLGSGCDQPLHSERFLPDESCIGIGVKALLALAAR